MLTLLILLLVAVCIPGLYIYTKRYIKMPSLLILKQFQDNQLMCTQIRGILRAERWSLSFPEGAWTVIVTLI